MPSAIQEADTAHAYAANGQAMEQGPAVLDWVKATRRICDPAAESKMPTITRPVATTRAKAPTTAAESAGRTWDSGIYLVGTEIELGLYRVIGTPGGWMPVWRC